jgi:hypothetical protein
MYQANQAATHGSFNKLSILTHVPAPTPIIICIRIRSYANDLATWGYACALYDISEVLTDTATVAAMRFIIDSCGRDVQVGFYPTKPLMMINWGHAHLFNAVLHAR